MTEVEAVVNNQPLCVTSNSSEDLTPNTPMELVNGRKLDQLPDPNKRQNITSLTIYGKKDKSSSINFGKDGIMTIFYPKTSQKSDIPRLKRPTCAYKRRQNGSQ
jgi:hypothetical protein